MLIELFFVGEDKDSAAINGMVFDEYSSALDYAEDYDPPLNVYSATVGVNATDLSEVTE